MKEWQPPILKELIEGEVLWGEYLFDWVARCMAELGLPPFDEDNGLAGALHLAFERIEELQEIVDEYREMEA